MLLAKVGQKGRINIFYSAKEESLRFKEIFLLEGTKVG